MWLVRVVSVCVVGVCLVCVLCVHGQCMWYVDENRFSSLIFHVQSLNVTFFRLNSFSCTKFKN